MDIERPHFENERGGERLVERKKEYRLQLPAGCAQRTASGVLAVGLMLGWLSGVFVPFVWVVVLPFSVWWLIVIFEDSSQRELVTMIWMYAALAAVGVLVGGYGLILLLTVRPIFTLDQAMYSAILAAGLVFAGFNYLVAWLLRRELRREKNRESVEFAMPVDAAYPALSSPTISDADNSHHGENNDATA